MVQIKMLQTRMGSEDGHTVRQYKKGNQYDMMESLAREFFAAGYAEKVVETWGDLDAIFSKLEPLPVFNAVELPTDEEAGVC